MNKRRRRTKELLSLLRRTIDEDYARSIFRCVFRPFGQNDTPPTIYCQKDTTTKGASTVRKQTTEM